MKGFGYTGGNIVLYNFMDKLAERNYEVYAITPKQRVKWEPDMAKGFLSRSENDAGSKIYHSAKEVLNNFPKTKELIKKGLGEGEPKPLENIKELTDKLLNNWVPSDFTISTYWSTSYANFMLMDKTVPLYHMQHYEELFSNDKYSQKLARLTYFMPLQLITNSSWLKKQMKRRLQKNPYLLTPATDQDIFQPHYDISNKYNNPDKIRILSYADARDFKGWDDGVNAMRKVFNSSPSDKDIEWITFGGYDPSEELDIPLDHKGKVFNEELAELYSKAHIVFLPSWYESFPLPPLEAMNCGTAVITTRYGTEDYAINEDNALVVRPRDPEALSEAILRLIENLTFAEELAISGVEDSKKVTWDKSADKLENILEDAKKSYEAGSRFSDVPDLARGKL